MTRFWGHKQLCAPRKGLVGVLRSRLAAGVALAGRGRAASLSRSYSATGNETITQRLDDSHQRCPNPIHR